MRIRASGRPSRLAVHLALACSLAAGAACSAGTARQQGNVSSTATTAVTLPGVPPGRPAPGGVAVTATGVVVPVIAAADDEDDGWVVGTPCGREATVARLTGLKARVVLDPGHGGAETGAIGPLGMKESDLNLAVVAHAQRALRAVGVTAIPTRTRDYRIAIASRAAIIEATDPEAVVSVHFNAVPSHIWSKPGTEIFYQSTGETSGESRRLAGVVYEEVTAALAELALTEWASTSVPGAKNRQNSEGDDFYGILRRTQGWATALAEIGFISNEAEERLYSDAGNQKLIGEAVARGIVRFLTTEDPGSGYVIPPDLADDGGRGGGTTNCTDPPLEPRG